MKKFNEIAWDIFSNIKQYQYKNESQSEFYTRLAKELSDTEKEKKEYFNLFSSMKALPAGRPVYALGTDRKNNTLSNCFVIKIKEDSMAGIMDAVKASAITQASGGGIGINFSILRPKNERIISKDSTTSGVVSFMGIFNATTETIKAGNNRRGAAIAILNIWHPEILDFITSKRKEGVLTNFNISVGITDDFMQRVIDDKDYDLRFPDISYSRYERDWDGDLEKWEARGFPVKIYKTMKARELYNKIIENAYDYAEPGIVFFDTVNKFNNILEICGKIDACNPCISKDTWVTTKEGPRQVKDLIGKKCSLLYNGGFEDSTEEGFFKTNKSILYRVTTKKGYTIDATLNHKFKTPSGDVELKNLFIGDDICLETGGASWKSVFSNMDDDFGYLIGHLIGDGTIRNNNTPVISVFETPNNDGSPIISHIESIIHKHFKDFKKHIYERDTHKETRYSIIEFKDVLKYLGMSYNLKTLTTEIEKMTSSEFQKRFIAGLVDTDGHISKPKSKAKKNEIQIHSTSTILLSGVQRMLSRFGIISKIKICKNAGIHNVNGQFCKCKALYCISISKDNIIRFKNQIKLYHPEKASRLETICEKVNLNKETYIDQIKSIEEYKIDDVYDVTIPSKHHFEANGIQIHNCGEEQLYASNDIFSSCNLAAVNVAAHLVFDKETNTFSFDFDDWENSTKLMVRALDRILDLNYLPLQEQRNAIYKLRQIGLGVTGLGSALALLNIPYGNNEKCISFLNKLFEKFRDSAYLESIALAKKHQPFELFNAEKFLNSGFVKTLPENIRKGIKKHGIRNSFILTCAPTGSISQLMNQCSSGIEPIFSKEYNRRIVSKGDEAESIIPVRDYAYSTILEYKELYGWSDKFIEDNFKLLETKDLNVDDHIVVQAEIQKYIDCSISKTINLAPNTTLEETKDVYLKCWKLGIKGCTIYRPSDVRKPILSTNADESNKNDKNDKIDDEFIPLADIEDSKRYRRTTISGDKAYVNVSYLEDNSPIEIFIKYPGDKDLNTYISNQSNTDFICRLITELLRKKTRVSRIIDIAKKCNYGSMHTIPAIISSVLSHHIPDEDFDDDDENYGPKCSKCGSSKIDRSSGCIVCLECGYGKCD